MKKQKEKKVDSSQSIKRLTVDPKCCDGVDSTTGIKVTAIDKNIFKKDIPEVVVKGK